MNFITSYEVVIASICTEVEYAVFSHDEIHSWEIDEKVADWIRS